MYRHLQNLISNKKKNGVDPDTDSAQWCMKISLQTVKYPLFDKKRVIVCDNFMGGII